MAPHHRAVDVAAGHEPARVSADPSRRLDAPEQKTPPRSSRPSRARAVTDTTGTTPIAAMHAALDSHPLARRARPWQTWVPRHSRRGDVATLNASTPKDSLRDRKERKTLRTYKALVKKNALLKTRGAALLCFALELLIPVAFVLLMCLPRALVSDFEQPAVFHRVAKIESLAWSRKPPSARAARLIYSPRTSVARAVAEAAGVTLVCGPDILEDTGRFADTFGGDTALLQDDGREDEDDGENLFASFAQQVAAAAALDVDIAAVLAGARDSNPLGSVGFSPSGGGSLDMFTNGIDPDLMQLCVADPVACASSAASAVRLRPDPPIALDSPLFAAPAKLRAEFCVASCVDDATCRRRVLDEFLVGVDTAEEAEALALGRSASATNVTTFPRQPAMAVVSLPPDLHASRARSVEYVIRVNASDTPTGLSGPAWAEEKLVRWVVGEDDKWREYWTYVNVQRAFDQALLSLALARDEDPEAFLGSDASDSGTESSSPLPLPRGARLDVRVKAYPFPAYSTNLGSTYAAVFFGLAFVFAFVVAAASTCQSVVLEKELRLREGMEIMGMERSAYWGSWFTTSYISLLVVSFLVSLIGSYPFKHTDWTVTFIFLAVWSAQLVLFCFFLSNCFKDAKVAAVAGALAYVLTWTPGVAAAAAQPDGSTAWLICTAMMPASGVYMWGWAVAILENAQRGARWDTLFRNLLADDEASGLASGTFSAGGVLLIALANALAYGALAWAVDVGATPLNALKRLKAFFARSSRENKENKERETRTQRADAWDVAAISDGVERDRFPFSHDTTAAVRVKNVFKTFGDTRALNGMSFAARRGEITALLGHNGAGKTTALSLLTGALQNFEGDAFLDGVDVKKHPLRARLSLGVCPQFDVLWPSLTVREHLELFAAFRPLGDLRAGSNLRGNDARVAASLAAVGLACDADRLAGTLSGGQRRKLSLAIAFIGEPSVVLLDEPTAGMDPVSRRHAWDVIRGLAGRRGTSERGGEGKTENANEKKAPVSVLLTTHFMDEADALSDRVAVVHSGKLACAGSPLFVKTAFGGGYVLRLRLRRDANLDAVKEIVERFADAKDKKPTPGSERSLSASFSERSDAGGETAVLTFALPCSMRASFPELLQALEGSRGEALGVLECGVGCATLEDAFLNVADLADGIRVPTDATPANSSALAPPERDARSTTSTGKKKKMTKTATFIAQTRATFWKRAVHCRRTFPSVVAGVVLAPLLFAAAGLAASSAAAKNAGDPRPASMLDLSFLGDAPIGIASSAGKNAFVSGTAWSPPADPSDVVALAGDAARTLLAEGVVAPFAGVDKVWDCSVDSTVLDACAHTCAECGPVEHARVPTDTLEQALSEKLAESVARNRSATPTFDAFASLDGVLLANTKPRATCATGRHAGFATCASLFVEPGAMDTSRPIPRNGARRFAYTVMTSSTAYHALPAAMAVAHDAIFRTLVGGNNARAADAIVSSEGWPSSSIEEEPTDDEDALPRLVSINHPLPGTREEKQEKALLSRLLVSLCVVVALSALSASAAAPFPAREVASGAKHLQMVSGARRDAYWCGTFLWDVCAQIPTLSFVLVILIAGEIAGEDEEKGNEGNARVVALVAALALFVVSATPLCYLAGSVAKFSSPAAAVASTLALFVFFGVAQLIAGVTLGGLAETGAGGGATKAWRFCRVAFLWLPHYCVGRVVFDVAGGFGSADAWAGDAGVETGFLDSNERSSSFRLPSTSTEALLAMGIEAAVYISLALLLEHADAFSFQRVWTEFREFRLRDAARRNEPGHLSVSSSATDDRIERGEVNGSRRLGVLFGSSRVKTRSFANDDDPSLDDARTNNAAPENAAQEKNAALVVRGLRKTFRGKPPASVSGSGEPLPDPHLQRRFAVDDVTFDVGRGESFALLGVNGAGKTTTFEMLTGALEPTKGDAYVLSRHDKDDDSGSVRNRFLSLRRDADAFRRAVGYCPQRDALFESLSAREHLLFYGALRGLSREESADAAARVMHAVGLAGDVSVRPAREYSGGNKRALAVAIALMGDPACVLLDEPSTGMDPIARRRLWRALDAASKRSGVAFVLTSHSMEEAEALCGKVGLVEQGTLCHVGDVDAWRAALGTGHALEMRLRDASFASREAVAKFARQTFRTESLSSCDEEDDSARVVVEDDARAGLVKCRVPRRVPLSFVFQQVEAHRDALGVEEYQVGAATLEETFLRFAGRGAR